MPSQRNTISNHSRSQQRDSARTRADTPSSANSSARSARTESSSINRRDHRRTQQEKKHYPPSRKIHSSQRTRTSKTKTYAFPSIKRILIICSLIELVFSIALCIRFDDVPLIIERAAFGIILLWLSTTDIVYRIIPNAAILASIVLRVAYLAFTLKFGEEQIGIVWNSVIGCLVIGIFAFAISLITEQLSGREGLGGGDVKLLAVTGLFFGLEGGFLVLFLACIAALARYALSRTSNGTFPFGPAISLACGVVSLI